MAEMQNHHSSIDPRSGYCSSTQIYHNLRDNSSLPSPSIPLSLTDYAFSLLHSCPEFSPSSPVFIDAFSHLSLSYSTFINRVHSLSYSLSFSYPSLSYSKVALILSPSSFHVPILYFSLLSLGVVISPANPLSTQSELTHIIQLAQPSVIFAVSSLSSKLTSFNLPVILLDSPKFDNMMSRDRVSRPPVSVKQSDTAVIMYSSGTTGRVKGVELTHRNFIVLLCGLRHQKLNSLEEEDKKGPAVSLFILPLFHVFGFFMMLRAVSMAETLVLMPKFDFEKMLQTIEKYRVTYVPVSPPLVLALANSDLVKKYDLSSLDFLGCGGAPLGKEVAQKFKTRFPNVEVAQGYGLTETAGGVASTVGPEESERYGSVGRLREYTQAMIVDPSTGDALPPGQKGELWLRAPTIMKGYVGDKEATAATFYPDGWLKTGDLCYFDSDGYLYIVDRLKELIKYKGYQVPPAELEHLLLSHPEIADAAVIPYPDEEAGQIPMAYIVRKPESSITASQVMDFVAKQVSPYKRIRRVAFVNIIPKNPSGKILRRELVNQATTSPSKL
ncbi:4-coumarate--CoA ligase-like 9 [Amaranthus tricolor]|uniref:4-coumarate--CoA ligase-like 9 n=1 Tax=Amaranthus tricolor TaxID=29722 RepID=UPI00258EC9C4|nr:4-coumarate--CoA ligase-like 9 [Amaranthus tricolor]